MISILRKFGTWLLFWRRNKTPTSQASVASKTDAPKVGRPNPGESTPSASTTGLAGTAAVAAGVAASVSSPSAQAGVNFGAIAEAVVGKLAGPLQEILNSFFQGLTGLFEMGSNTLTSAIGKQGDAVIEAVRSVYNKNVARATEPSPDPCGSKSGGAAIVRGRVMSDTRNRTTDQTLAELGMSVTKGTTQEQATRRVALHNKYKQNPDLKHADIMGSHLFAQSSPDMTLATEDEKEAATAFVNNVLGSTPLATPKLFNGDEDERPEAKIYQSEQLTYQARVSLARNAINSIKESRIAQEGERSKMGALQYEVDRRLGNGEWHDQIEGYADATPVSKEMAKVLALQNSILLEQVYQNEHTMALLATILLDTLEDPARKERIESNYVSTT